MTPKRDAARATDEPSLSPALLERVLAKLGLKKQPTTDLAGLNAIYAAACGGIPFDNIQKRIWLRTDRTKPVTGGDPNEFFQNWVQHGTGGTCWPTSGGMYALARALGFAARRIAGSVIVHNYPSGANHGSVLVTLDGLEYLFDFTFGSFKVPVLVPGKASSTGTGIHNVDITPLDGDGWELSFFMGWSTTPLPFRYEPENDPVDHGFFIDRHDRASRVGFFNDTLLFRRRFADSIVTVGRGKKRVIASDGTMTKTDLTTAQRDELLVNELGLSEEIVARIPPDIEDGLAPF
jgi:arylamine N-acetyltransferase